MSRLLLLYCTLVISVLFVLFPDWDGTYMTPDPFMFYSFPIINGKQSGIALQTYWYMIAEHIILLILVGIIANESTEHRTTVWILFGLFGADLIDFLLTYNSVWGYLHFRSFDFTLSMNTTSFLIFGTTILVCYAKEKIRMENY